MNILQEEIETNIRDRNSDEPDCNYIGVFERIPMVTYHVKRRQK